MTAGSLGVKRFGAWLALAAALLAALAPFASRVLAPRDGQSTFAAALCVAPGSEAPLPVSGGSPLDRCGYCLAHGGLAPLPVPSAVLVAAPMPEGIGPRRAAFDVPPPRLVARALAPPRAPPSVA